MIQSCFLFKNSNNFKHRYIYTDYPFSIYLKLIFQKLIKTILFKTAVPYLTIKIHLLNMLCKKSSHTCMILNTYSFIYNIRCNYNAPVICNHTPFPRPGGRRGIAGQMCHVSTFALSQKCAGNDMNLIYQCNVK